MKIIPPYDKNNEWFSPWELMEIDSINQSQMELLSHLEAIVRAKDDEYNLNSYFSVLNNSNDIDYSIMKREVNNNRINFFSKSLIFYLCSMYLKT